MSERRKTFQKKQEPRKFNRGSFIRVHKRRHRRASLLRRLLMLALAALFLYGAVRLVLYGVQSAKIRSTNEALSEMYEQAASEGMPAASPAPSASAATAPTVLPDMELLDAYQYMGDALLPKMAELHADNPDTVAWLQIPGVVSLPVVYRDNSYYLDHDFYGKKSNGGTLFLDEAHPFEEDSQYLVIHGHNMYDGGMFGLLTHYSSQSYALEHPTVYFDTLYREEEYEVVGALRLPVSVQDSNYIAFNGTRKFRNTDQLGAFLNQMQEKALYWKEDAQLLPSDALLALSTCYNDERIVVFCRRVLP